MQTKQSNLTDYLLSSIFVTINQIHSCVYPLFRFEFLIFHRTIPPRLICVLYVNLILLTLYSISKHPVSSIKYCNLNVQKLLPDGLILVIMRPWTGEKNHWKKLSFFEFWQKNCCILMGHSEDTLVLKLIFVSSSATVAFENF